MDFKKYLKQDIENGWVYGVSETIAKMNRYYYHKHSNSIKTSLANERYDIVKVIFADEDSRKATVDMLNSLKADVEKKSKKEADKVDEFICNIITEKTANMDELNKNVDVAEFLVSLKANEINIAIHYLETY